MEGSFMVRKAIRSILEYFALRRVRSTSEVLSRFLSYDEIEGILKINPDLREMPKSVAEKLRIKEDELIRKAAEKLELEYCSNPDVCDEELLPSTLTLSLLRDAGAVVVPGKKGELKIICCEPLLVHLRLISKKLMGPATPVALSTWGAIQKSLLDGEKLREERRIEREERETRSAFSLIAKALSMIIGEAERYGRSSVVVTLSDKESTYTFTTAEGKKAVGVLHQTVAEALRLIIVEKKRPLEGITRAEGTLIETLRYRTERGSEGEKILYFSWNRVKPRIPLVGERGEVVLSESSTSRILLVDDNPTFARVLTRFLSKENIDALYAREGKVALELLESLHDLPDLIVCDVHMPGMNGHEFVAKIKADSRYSKLPIVMLTSDSETSTKVNLVTLGIDAFVNKAEDPRVLLAHITTLLAKTGKKAA